VTAVAGTPCATGRFADGTPLASPGGLSLVCRGVDLAGLLPGDRVLDLGCGRGATAAGLRAARGLDVVGVDVASQPADGCVCADAAALPFDRGSVHGALLECALSVMADPGRVLGECARVLAPGGRLVLLDLYARAPRAETAPNGGVFLRGRDEVLGLVAAAGLAVIACEDHTDALRTLTARLLLERGSLDDLFGPRGCGLTEVRELRPGYLLVVAAARGSSGARVA